MSSVAIANDRFSIITIADPGVQSPSWANLLGWPSMGDDHVALSGDRADRHGIWAAQLDQAVMRADRAVVLVAEGLGCFATTWWARLSPTHYVERVAGALLFDPGQEVQPERRGQFRSPSVALPFPSVVLGRRLAPDANPDLSALVDTWGGRFVEGHRQRGAEQTAWRSAKRLMARMSARVVERDIERGLALRGVIRLDQVRKTRRD